jgi:hypothetical protein
MWPSLYAWPLALAFVFPDGRLPSRRWRAAAALAAASVALLIFGLATGGRNLEKPFADVANPLPVHFSKQVAAFFVFPALAGTLASLILGAAAIRMRYGGSGGTERLQLLWLAYAVLLLPLGLFVCALWQLVTGDLGAGPFAVLLVMHAAVAGSVAIAVTRYRLYEIDRLLRDFALLLTCAAGQIVLPAALVEQGDRW